MPGAARLPGPALPPEMAHQTTRTGQSRMPRTRTIGSASGPPRDPWRPRRDHNAGKDSLLLRPLRRDFSWTVRDDAVLAFALVLLAHVVERGLQRRDTGLEVGLHLAPLHLEAVHLAHHVFDARLRLLHHQ